MQKVGQHRSYIDANKLANVRREIMKKNRLAAAEIEEIKMKIRESINTTKKSTRCQSEVGKPNSRASRKHHRTSKTGK